MNEVKFTATEKRIFELGFSKEPTGPEAVALRKLIDVFPWLVDVAECKFDSEVGKACLQVHAGFLQLQIAKENYNKRQTEEPKPAQE